MHNKKDKRPYTTPNGNVKAITQDKINRIRVPAIPIHSPRRNETQKGRIIKKKIRVFPQKETIDSAMMTLVHYIMELINGVNITRTSMVITLNLRLTGALAQIKRITITGDRIPVDPTIQLPLQIIMSNTIPPILVKYLGVILLMIALETIQPHSIIITRTIKQLTAVFLPILVGIISIRNTTLTREKNLQKKGIKMATGYQKDRSTSIS